jgi:hypothetical protein
MVAFPKDHWRITPEERAKHDALFNELSPNSQFLPGLHFFNTKPNQNSWTQSLLDFKENKQGILCSSPVYPPTF